MNLTDELTKKQVLKFQIDSIQELKKEFIERTLSENIEGIFNLHSKIDTHSAETLTGYLKRNNKNYEFELNYTVTNYEIMFKKKGENS